MMPDEKSANESSDAQTWSTDGRPMWDRTNDHQTGSNSEPCWIRLNKRFLSNLNSSPF